MAAKGARATAGKMSKKGGAQPSKPEPKIEARAGKKPAPKAKGKAAPFKAPPPKKGGVAKGFAEKAAAAKAEPMKKAAAKAEPMKKAVAKAEPMKKAAPAKVEAMKKAAPAKAMAKKPVAAKPEAMKAPVTKAVPEKAASKAVAKKAKTNGGGADSVGLRAGDAVPDVDLVDHDGNAFSLGSLKGESYVLYFYPKDDTPGCTREACAFRDDHGKYGGAGVRVIGVSPDKPESHVRFREKYGLPFTLLSDAERAAANAFGVWVKKQNYGREYMGIERSTFLVDESGKVKKVWRNVKVDGHSQAVLDASS